MSCARQPRGSLLWDDGQDVRERSDELLGDRVGRMRVEDGADVRSVCRQPIIRLSPPTKTRSRFIRPRVNPKERDHRAENHRRRHGFWLPMTAPDVSVSWRKTGRSRSARSNGRRRATRLEERHVSLAALLVRSGDRLQCGGMRPSASVSSAAIVRGRGRFFTRSSQR
jgi:hypothetical protein